MLATLRLPATTSRITFRYGLSSGSKRHGSTFPRQQSFLPFFTRAKAPTCSVKRRLLLAIPLGAGLTLLFAPKKPHLLPAVFASPNLIPCPPPKALPSDEMPMMINSPDEEERSIISRIIRFLRIRIWEPLQTVRRFIHLFLIFIPVILTSPMLLVGEREPRYKGDGWGAVWWYDLLVSAMQRAGPTFTKVSATRRGPLCNTQCHSLARSMGCVPCRPFPFRALSPNGSATF